MDTVRAYIEYLRDVSRRIICRANFENILPIETRRRKNLFYSVKGSIPLSSVLLDDIIIIKPEDTNYTYFEKAANYVETYNDKKLFLGVGLISGKFKTKKINAPLIICTVEIQHNDNSTITYRFEKNTLQLNYDVLSNFIEDFMVSDEDYDATITPEVREKFRTIDTIADKLETYVLKPLSILENLKTSLPHIAEIEVRDTPFKKNETDGLIYFDDYYLFVNNVPDELSTFESLNDLLEKETVDNTILNNLLINALTNHDEPYLCDTINESEIEKALSQIPLELSTKQIEGIKKVWNNGITYIEGPPGTGKSHTIIAILISAFLLQKKVLLVSHKKAALDIVKNRIDKEILGTNAVVYVGLKDRRDTWAYIRRLMNHGPRIERMGESVACKDEEIANINKTIKDLVKSIRRDLDKIRKAYHENIKYFKDKIALEEYYPEHSISNYKTDIPINENSEINHNKAIEKYGKLRNMNGTRVDKLYCIKTQKYFKDKFNGIMRYLQQNDISYVKTLYDANLHFSRHDELVNRVKNNEETFDRNRIKFVKKIHERKTLLKKYLPEYYAYTVLKNLNNDAQTQQSVDKYCSSLYRTNPKLISNYFQQVDFNSLLNVFPLWCAKLRDLNNVLPMRNGMFDLVIIDEASQVNIAEIIPAFYRGKRFCIVGDDKQLHLNATGVGFSLSKAFDLLCWQKNDMHQAISFETAKNNKLLVSDSSILNFINKTGNLTPRTELDEHYRSLPMLASFNNHQFYGDNWKIMTENGDNINKTCFMPKKVNGQRDGEIKYVKQEVDETVALVKDIVINKSFLTDKYLKQFNFTELEPPTIGVLSFLTNQKSKLIEAIDQVISEEDREKYDLRIDTSEGFQGNERDIMILTLGLDEQCRWNKGFYENPNRFNVATSRAKYFTYFVYAGIPATASLLRKYLNHFHCPIRPEDEIDTDQTVWKQFVEEENKFDQNKFESIFESNVCHYLLKYIKDRSYLKLFNQVKACGQKRLDFVIYNPTTKITCAIEVDGKEHFVDDTREYTEAHLERISVLRRAKWEIVNIKYYNWYDFGRLKKETDTAFKNEISDLYKQLDARLGIYNTLDLEII